MPLEQTSVTYAHAHLKIDDYWNRGITGQGVKIGIVDDGMGTHPALPISGGLACGAHTTYMQENQHATNCAGIALGRNLNNGEPTGIAPDAELYSIRMYYRTFADRVRSLIEAIDYAIEVGIDILSMSIHIVENSYFYDREGASNGRQGVPKHLRLLIRDAFYKAYKHGVIIVVAAGNNNDGSGEDNIEFEELLPKMPNVIAVANLSPSGIRRDTSGVGRWVDVAGFGTMIRSTIPGGGYSAMTGTSMATPQIAGVFALYKQLFAELCTQEIIEKVFESCVTLPEMNSDQQGRGIPQPPSELYRELAPLVTASNQFRMKRSNVWVATDSFARNENNEWEDVEAMGIG